MAALKLRKYSKKKKTNAKRGKSGTRSSRAKSGRRKPGAGASGKVLKQMLSVLRNLERNSRRQLAVQDEKDFENGNRSHYEQLIADYQFRRQADAHAKQIADLVLGPDVRGNNIAANMVAGPPPAAPLPLVLGAQLAPPMDVMDMSMPSAGMLDISSISAVDDSAY
nr:MAG: hypothetical protein [Chemarfal virus 47]